jgi:hypothetical protein
LRCTFRREAQSWESVNRRKNLLVHS